MSANPRAPTRTRRKKIAQRKRRHYTASGCASQNASGPERAKKGEEFPAGWIHLTLGEVGRWVGGGTPSKANPRFWTGGNIPWVSPKDMKCDLITDARDHITEEAVGQSATNLVETDSVLVVVRSGILRRTLPVAVSQRPVALNQDLKAVKPRESVRSDYLALALKAFEHDILHTCTKTGTTVHSLELPIFLRFKIPVAPLSEQQRIIAEIEKQFTRLESGVAALRRVQANLKRYRAAVLKAACEGCLVPTEAELAKTGSRKEKFETGEELLTRILTDRRQGWKGRGKYKEPAAPDTAKLPPLSEGWVWATLEQLCPLFADSAHRTPKYGDSGDPALGPRDVVGGRLNLAKARLVDGSEFSIQTARHIPQPGDIVYSRELSLGWAAAVPDGQRLCMSQGMCLFRPHRDVNLRYFLALLNGPVGRKHAENAAMGSAHPHINLGDIKAYSFPLPPLAEQTRIVTEVERRLSVVEELDAVVSASLQRAIRLRQSILQRAFAGDLVAHEPAALSAHVIELPKVRRRKGLNVHFARALLSAEIVHRLHLEPTLGRTKHQKIFHLCEHIAQIEEIQGQYHREAAGPLDNKLIYANAAELKKQKWYQEVHRESFGHTYEPLAKAGSHRKYVESYWPDKLPVIDKLIELMRTWDTDRCEVFCTAYAAWNDLILWGKEPNEAAILREILDRWHDRKRRFSKERWCKAIGWMKKEGFVPNGFGKPTREAE